MIPAISAVKFTSANNYSNKQKCQKMPISQQSFGGRTSTTFALLGMFLTSIVTTAASGAEKAADNVQAAASSAGKIAKKSVQKSILKPNPKLEEMCRRCESQEEIKKCLVEVPAQFIAPGGDIDLIRMNIAALRDFEAMREAASKDPGVDLVIRSALQDEEYPTKVAAEMDKRRETEGDIFLVDEPKEHKQHLDGRAIDVTTIKPHDENEYTTITDIRNEEFTTWLAKEGKKYNYIVPDPTDAPQHMVHVNSTKK